MLRLIKKHNLLFLSVVFFITFTMTVSIFAATPPYSAPPFNSELNPTCLPSDSSCYVAIYPAVSGATNGQYLQNNSGGETIWADIPLPGDNTFVGIATTPTTNLNLLNTAGSTSIPSITFSPTGSSPTSVSVAISAASDTAAGFVSASAQNIGGVKTFSSAPIISTLAASSLVFTSTLSNTLTTGGTIGAAQGGTGNNTYSSGAILYGSGTGSISGVVGTAGRAILSQGSNPLSFTAGTLTLDGNLTKLGASALTFTVSGSTDVTIPAGTTELVDLATPQTLTTKTLTSPKVLLSGGTVGDMYYRAPTTGLLTRLPIGTDQKCLLAIGSPVLPVWDRTCSAAGAAGNVQYNSSNSFAGDNNFFWDDAANKLGIGTSAPQERLDVVGNIQNVASAGSTVDDPVVVGTATGLSSPFNVAVSGRYAYVTNGGANNMKVIDISNPVSPTIVGTATGLSTPFSIAVSGRYAYVTNITGGTMNIIDISNPSSPTTVGTTTGLSNPRGLAISGRYAYVTNFSGTTMSIIDVSNPVGTPPIVGTATGLSNPQGVAISGKYAYVANFSTSGTMSIIDISNPSSPTTVGTATELNGSLSVAVSGRYAYVTNYNINTMSIIDISNPVGTFSRTVGTTTGLSTPYGITISGRYAYVANLNGATMSIIDVSIPAGAPPIVGTAIGLSSPYGITTSGRYAYAPNNGANTLSVIDLHGLETTSASIHSLEAGNLQVRNDIIAQGQLQITGGITAGNGGIYSAGAIGVSGPTIPNTVSDKISAATFNANVSGSSNYVAEIRNTSNSATSNGLLITAGNTTGTAGSEFIAFRKQGSTTPIASITQTGASSVAYNVTSDLRLKENLTETHYSLSDLLNIEVKDFSFKSDPTHTQTTGFIAQNLNEVFPMAVATNGDDGTTELIQGQSPWMVDYGRITPLIVKSIQDMNLKITQINDLNIANDWRDSLIAWFGNVSNNITSIFTGELCITSDTGESECLNRGELEQLEGMI